jgi:hypothetical protein
MYLPVGTAELDTRTVRQCGSKRPCPLLLWDAALWVSYGFGIFAVVSFDGALLPAELTTSTV